MFLFKKKKPSRFELEKLSRAIFHIDKVKMEIGDFEGRLEQAIFLLTTIRVIED